MCRFSSLRATACLVCIYPWGFTSYTAGNSFKSLNFDFLSLIGVSDSEVFIVLILIYFSLLIHVKTSAAWGGGRSPPHQSRTAYYLKKKMFNLNPKAYTQGPCWWGIDLRTNEIVGEKERNDLKNIKNMRDRLNIKTSYKCIVYYRGLIASSIILV